MEQTKKIIIQKLASKYNLPLQTVENIVMHQFKFVNNIMSQGQLKTIRLPYFGKFHVNKKRLKYINNGSTDNK
tara:strand:+ start:1528 stop:1746 length:219 start_codon:yes stop_codon:yes gene_type:complete